MYRIITADNKVHVVKDNESFPKDGLWYTKVYQDAKGKSYFQVKPGHKIGDEIRVLEEYSATEIEAVEFEIEVLQIELNNLKQYIYDSKAEN